jgi:hypothetical protein
VGGAVVSTGVSSLLDVEGKKIDSSGLDPTLQELDMWKKAADIYRSGLVFSEAGKTFHSLTVALADLVADVRATDGKLTDQQIEEKVAVLTAKDAEMSKTEADLRAKIGELDKIKAGIDAIDPAKKSALDMEKDIWFLWMGSLKLNSNILDINAIEDHIGPKGLKLVDFGWYTSDADENEAIEHARDMAAQLNAEAQATSVPEDKSRQLRILTR